MDSFAVCDVCKKPIPVGSSYIVVSAQRMHQQQECYAEGIHTNFLRTLCEDCALKERLELNVAELIKDMPTVEEEMADREETEKLIEWPEDDKPTTTSCSKCGREFVPGDHVIELSLSKYDFDRPNVDKVYGLETWCYCPKCLDGYQYKSVPLNAVEGFDKE